MGTVERRNREREERREQILAAARELFLREGFENVTIPRIADKIEYAPGTIYGYFQDKDDLLWNICQEGFDRMSLTARAARDSQAHPLEQLTAMGRAYIDFALDFPQDFTLMFATENMNEAFQQRVMADLIGDYSDLEARQVHGFLILLDVVQRCMAEGCLSHGPVQVVATTFWSFVHGLTTLYLTGKMKMMLLGEVPREHLYQSLDYLMASLRHDH